MASIVPGYEYDIFISYRQKDNKGDKWVSEFVDALKTELESTFKEEISVYFDINPHDGLLETHDVDASLKDKLKCLVFIPIISRTYCDPKSFAWEHEFKAFVEQVSQDQFGLKVKLPNGNVASRVLPVRIHDLDNADIKLCESVLGGVLRGVEFIYKEPGVNRPLTKRDKEKRNLNKTIYRNQINKVANAVREIILGTRSGETISTTDNSVEQMPWEEVIKEKKAESKEIVDSKKLKILLGFFLVLVIVALIGIYIYPRIFKKGSLEKMPSPGERLSVVVLSFQNLTNDTIWNIWQSGIQNELITYLTNYEELKVRQIGTINSLFLSRGILNYASITPSQVSSISQKLEATVSIFGSINQAGNLIHVNTQLIDSRTDDIIKSFQIECPAKEEMIFNIIDSLSVQVKDFLILTKLKKESLINKHSISSTNSLKAYRYFSYGNDAFFKKMDYVNAIRFYTMSLDNDSNYLAPKTMISVAYANSWQYDLAKKWCLKIYEQRNKLSITQNIHINWLHSMLFETPTEEISFINQLLEIDDQDPGMYYELGRIYVALEEYDKAIEAMKKALKIYSKWETKPIWSQDYIMLGYAYQKTGQFKKEMELYKKAEHYFPGDWSLNQRQAIMYLSVKDTLTANYYIDKFVSELKSIPYSDLDIAPSLGYIYTEGGYPEKAERVYLKSMAIAPENPTCLNNLGWFLIDQDKNINEGMELIDKALKIRPNGYIYLETKGWGLFKQRKYQEALAVLQKSWDIRRQNAVYDHEAFLHLEEAKKAVAGQ